MIDPNETSTGLIDKVYGDSLLSRSLKKKREKAAQDRGIEVSDKDVEDTGRAN